MRQGIVHIGALGSIACLPYVKQDLFVKVDGTCSDNCLGLKYILLRGHPKVT